MNAALGLSCSCMHPLTRACAYEVLSSGFAETSNIVSFDAGFPSDQDPYTDEYDYESDSDLDDEDEILKPASSPEVS